MPTPRSAWKRYSRVAAAVSAVIACCSGRPAAAQDIRARTAEAEARAVTYLAAEVPRWRREHACYSCHNNGDGTRALIAASARGHEIGGAIAETLAWLATPIRWNPSEFRGSEDLPLARVQFASALGAMAAVGRATPAALDEAAAQLVPHQQPDGSWRLSDSPLGGATFYGTSLATALARASLARAPTARVGEALERASAWLRTAPTAIALDASSIVLGLGSDADAAAVAQRQRALETLKGGQGPDGGWGPYVSSQSEPFDTALALLALADVRRQPGLSPAPYALSVLDEAIDGARTFLISTQTDDGSWPETTRPPGGESYAQRISTTAWALLALFASDR